MPLAMAIEGETRTITDFKGQEEMKRHLQDLGLDRKSTRLNSSH